MPLINFSGLASGIDSEALIEATSEAARLTRVVPYEDRVSEITEENEALTQLKTLLSDLKGLGEDFMTLNGGVVSKLASSSDETVLTAVASNLAQPGSYDITVNQLAKNAVFSFSERPTDPDALINSSGDDTSPDYVTVVVGTGASQETIQVDADGKTWAQLTAELNGASENLNANLINVGTAGSPEYALVISSNNVGEEQGTLAISVDPDIIAYLDGTVPPASLDQATNAELELSGISGTIERSSNTFSDLIPNVTINLNGLPEGGPSDVTITVSNDTVATQGKVQAFIEKYNEIVAFIKENNQITREENGEEVNNIFGALASTRLDDGALSALRSALSSTTYEEGEAYRIPAELGIKTQQDGTLLFDTAVFETAMSQDPDAVKEIFQKFGDVIAKTDGTLDQYMRFNGLIDESVNRNKTRISDLNDRIAQAEASILKTEEILRARFARLESLVSSLQSQQNALTSALAGLQS